MSCSFVRDWNCRWLALHVFQRQEVLDFVPCWIRCWFVLCLPQTVFFFLPRPFSVPVFSMLDEKPSQILDRSRNARVYRWGMFYGWLRRVHWAVTSCITQLGHLNHSPEIAVFKIMNKTETHACCKYFLSCAVTARSLGWRKSACLVIGSLLFLRTLSNTTVERAWTGLRLPMF